MNVAGYLCCSLGLLAMIFLADAAGLQDKIDQQLFDSLTSENARMKKPFCNAFTGCGKKRSFYSQNAVNSHEENTDKVRIPVPIYWALLRVASREIQNTLDRQSNTDNAIPDAEIEYPTYLTQKIPRAARYES